MRDMQEGRALWKGRLPLVCRDSAAHPWVFLWASYACGVSEADRRAARGDELPLFRTSAHALVDGVADHLAALPSRVGLAAAPRRLARTAARPAPAGAAGSARRPGRDRRARCAAPRYGQRSSGLLRLGKSAAFPRWGDGFASGSGDEPERRRWRSRRRPPRACGGALAGRAGGLPSRTGQCATYGRYERSGETPAARPKQAPTECRRECRVHAKG